jgi:hypothetical protein
MHRIVGLLVFVALISLVLFPDLSIIIAHALGVGRGVDLIFYFSHLFLLLLIIGLWRRTLDMKATITKLTRAIALQHPIMPREEAKTPETTM